MPEINDFTDFLAAVYDGGGWEFDTQSMERVYEDANFKFSMDENVEIEELGQYMIDKAKDMGIDLTEFDLVKGSMAAAGDTELSPELLGYVIMGIDLSANLETIEAGNTVALGSTIIQATGVESEGAAKHVINQIIRDNDDNPNNDQHPDDQSNLRTAVFMNKFGAG